MPGTMFALRTVPHESTGFSPAELVYGQSLRSPLGMIKEVWEGKEENTIVVEYVLNLINSLQVMINLVEENMRQAQTHAKRYYDRGARHQEFRVGDKVIVLHTSRKNKLQVHWDGPVSVNKKISDTKYVIRKPKSQRVMMYHCNLIKPFVERRCRVNFKVNVAEELPCDFPELNVAFTPHSVDKILRLTANEKELTHEQLSDLRHILEYLQELFIDKPL